MTTDPEPAAEALPAGRPSYGTLMSRALQLRCPRCGEGPLFRSWFRMWPSCSHCNFRFDRGPGYYLGSIYINYGLTALVTTVVFLVGFLKLGMRKESLAVPLVLFTILFPMLLFRHARAWWLAMDCHFDPEVLSDGDVQESKDDA